MTNTTYISSDDTGGRQPFDDSSADVGGIRRARQGICEVVASCSAACTPRSRGTAVYVAENGAGGGYFATAAHVVRDEMGGDVWPDIRLRLDVDGAWHRAVVRKRGQAVDLAILETEAVPAGANGFILPRAEGDSDLLLAQGIRVLYAGYPLPSGPDGRCPLIVAQGMIAGTTVRINHQTKVVYPVYIIDGMVNLGMSGGPVFCPHTGVLAGIITEVVAPQLFGGGHGWGHALPSDGVVHYLRAITT